jgi:hypothetical protein
VAACWPPNPPRRPLCIGETVTDVADRVVDAVVKES